MNVMVLQKAEMVSTATQCRSRNDTGIVAEGVFTLVLVCMDTHICIFPFHSIFRNVVAERANCTTS